MILTSAGRRFGRPASATSSNEQDDRPCPPPRPPRPSRPRTQLAAGRDELAAKSNQAANAASDAADNASAAAKNAAQDAGQAVSDAAQQAKNRAGEYVTSAKQELYNQANEAKSLARQKVAEVTETGKNKVAGEVNVYGSAIDKAAKELEKNDDPAAPVVRAAAQKVQEFGSFLDNKNTSDLVNQAEMFARRHPEVVLGGMFVLGLGLARFFKSTREPLPPRRRTVAGARTAGRYGSTAGGYGAADTRFAGPRYDGNYASGGYAATRTPARLSNPTPGGSGKAVTVLEETSTVVPANPK